MAVFIVAYDVRSDADRSAVEKYLADFRGHQIKLELSLYLVDSTSTAAALRDALASKIDKRTDRLWVSAFNGPAAWHNAIENDQVMEWLQRRGHA